MRCDEIIRLCRELAPEELACDWDNPGLLAGRSDREVEKILLAVDVTDEVINQAAEWGADMIISHHPLIFRGIKKVNDTDFVGRRILRLIQKDISCYAMHTNFDAAPGCMADRAAEMLGLSDTKVLEVLGSLADGKPYGIGLSGSLAEEMTLMELARRVKETFNIPHVSVFGDLDSGKKLKCAAICPGSGGSEIELVLGTGAEVYITGDISHHEGLDAAERGLAVIDAGHYGIEHIFMPIMEKYLGKVLPKEIKIRRAADIFPQKVV